MRRLAPRPAAEVFERVRASLEPATTLARVQAQWRDVVGGVIGEESRPVSERGGVVTVACRSAVWSQELAMMAPELVKRLNETLADEGREAPVSELRFRVGTDL